MALTFQDAVFGAYHHGMHGDAGGTVARAFLEETSILLRRRGVELTPNIVLRIAEILSLALTGRQIERALSDEQTVQPPPGDIPPVNGRSTLHPLAEALAKNQERLRKALKELEESFTRGGAPVEVGLADELRPLLLQAEGVLDDALAHGK